MTGHEDSGNNSVTAIEKEAFYLRNIVMDLISLQDIMIRIRSFLGLQRPDDVQLASHGLLKDWCMNLVHRKMVVLFMVANQMLVKN